ncbi:hypothetical protein ACWD11_16725 [Streptomyces sp. NPDC002776]
MEIDVDKAVLRTTVTHHLLAQGLAYPTFYRRLFTTLRVEPVTVAELARDGGWGRLPRGSGPAAHQVGFATLP